MALNRGRTSSPPVGKGWLSCCGYRGVSSVIVLTLCCREMMRAQTTAFTVKSVCFEVDWTRFDGQSQLRIAENK